MDEVQIVQESYRSQQLAREGLNVGAWEGYESAGFEEVENGEAEERCDYAYVTSPVEAVM